MIVTQCCKASIIQKHGREYPLGGSTWYINTVVNVCERCGDEHPDMMEVDGE